MSTTETLPADTSAFPPEPAGSGKSATRNGWQALAMRLHFYAGVFVAPFILIAAVTGALYAISPTLENFTSKDLLQVEPQGAPKPLAEQVSAAVKTQPNLALVAVAPAPGAQDTTRVIFNDPSLGESERRAVFVNPYTAQPVGDSVVYGSSGALELRTWIDQLHRSLHLGETGRLYAELAASWLWIIALAGLVLWVRRVRGRRQRNSAKWLLTPDRAKPGRAKTMNWHGAIGLWTLPVLLLIAATGMTWSTYAGANVTALREQLSWTTPVVSAQVPGSAAPAPASGGDHHHAGHEMPKPENPEQRIGQLDVVYAVARADGITQGSEISVPSKPGQAFVVKERRLPGTYTVDAVAVDGSTGQVTDRLAFADWPLMAKLTNWGIAFHMGLLFGLPNQLLLLAAMIGLIFVICYGYRMWWQRRPTRGGSAFGRAPRRGVLRKTSPWITVPLVLAAAGIGWFAPLVGLSLVAFLIVDVLVGLVQRNRATTV
ncbi:PepSY-associated TM helix domain-containing protein [Nocardia sp. NPDC051832]|uniref:PepSY-associated TM helix domain-containing protein n=1 Tax=Nocardia sp. NPDC051832 TaxID=3155673 RepID=UPI0034138720